MQFVTPRSLIRMYRHQLRPPTGNRRGTDGDGTTGDGLAGNGVAASARIGARKVRRAVDLLWVDGWQLACDPTLLMPDWPIVAVERGHELAWVYKATFETSGRDGEMRKARPGDGVISGRTRSAAGSPRTNPPMSCSPSADKRTA